jgi:multimeric flavodoxin WrbA
MKKGIIIQGSSASFGDTYKVVSYVCEKSGYDFVDLKTKRIGQFDYDFQNRDDDFLPLIKDIVDQYDLIIFATPVYWYTMSGTMKKFIDRISDCLKIEKEIGRKLRNKKMAVISCSNDDELKHGFYMPFIETAKYLGMEYIGEVHAWIENDEISENVISKLDHFVQQLGNN